MDYVERNYRIIEKTMISQMERSFEIGRKLIDSELDAGLFNFVVKPIVKTFYNWWTDKDARTGTLQQIKITLDSGKELLNNGNSEEKFGKIVEENFPLYLKGDQTYRQCKKNHKNYKKLKEITKQCFITQLKETIELLKINKENVNSYDDLCKEVFKTKENAFESLIQQLNYNEEGIKIVESDPTILKIPTGRKIIVKTLRKGFEITKKELIENLNQTFAS
ncbi:MAG: hypothetical protein ACTSQJ_13175 [Promethearchaeota archaeon]